MKFYADVDHALGIAQAQAFRHSRDYYIAQDARVGHVKVAVVSRLQLMASTFLLPATWKLSPEQPYDRQGKPLKVRAVRL